MAKNKQIQISVSDMDNYKKGKKYFEKIVREKYNLKQWSLIAYEGELSMRGAIMVFEFNG